MKKNKDSKIEVELTLKNIVNYILHYLVHLQLKYNLYSTGKFKAGDYVRYNWKAKLHIPTVYERNFGTVRKISSIITHSDGSQVCRFEPQKDGLYDGSDIFWICKVKISKD